jgi:ATP-grasp ribosomal peptide maturase
VTDAAVLVVTSIEDFTADLVITALNTRGVPVVRVDPADIGSGLAFSARIGAGRKVWSGPITTLTRRVDLGRVRSVYWRRPSPWRYDDLPQQARDFARAEARHGLFGVLTALPVRYVSHPIAAALADYKPVQLTTAAELGFTVPPTLITNDLAEARQFAGDYAPVVYKTFRGVPAAEHGDTGAIWTQRVTAEELDESIAVCPHMLQVEIAKNADLRVTVVGDTVFASIIKAPERLLDWRAGDWDTFVYEPYEVPGPVAKALVAYLDHFGLAFGCFDLIVDTDEKVWWIECNPNGQWGFLPDAAAIADAFAALLQAG